MTQISRVTPGVSLDVRAPESTGECREESVGHGAVAFAGSLVISDELVLVFRMTDSSACVCNHDVGL